MYSSVFDSDATVESTTMAMTGLRMWRYRQQELCEGGGPSPSPTDAHRPAKAVPSSLSLVPVWRGVEDNPGRTNLSPASVHRPCTAASTTR